MNYNLRKSDSLAHATGSFKHNLDDLSLNWSENVDVLEELGPKIIGGINEAANSKKGNEDIKNLVKTYLTDFGKILNAMEKTNADMIDLMIEMEGLDFPLKNPKRILKLCEKEENNNKFLQNIVKNLSKTFSFVDAVKTDKELLMNSLQSFETAFSEFQEIADLGINLTANLKEELEKEHVKAKKYLGKV